MNNILPALAFLSVILCGGISAAQESPFFVTYTHHMEEPGNLELETSSTTGIPKGGQRFYFAPYMELEYGVTASWTTELYLEIQSVWDTALYSPACAWRIGFA